MQLIIKEISLGDVNTFAFDEDKQICLANGNVKEINVASTMQSLLNVLCGAEQAMVNNRVIDGITYEITILKNGETRNYYFKNSFPRGFAHFAEILGGLR